MGKWSEERGVCVVMFSSFLLFLPPEYSLCLTHLVVDTKEFSYTGRLGSGMFWLRTDRPLTENILSLTQCFGRLRGDPVRLSPVFLYHPFTSPVCRTVLVRFFFFVSTRQRKKEKKGLCLGIDSVNSFHQVVRQSWPTLRLVLCENQKVMHESGEDSLRGEIDRKSKGIIIHRLR